MRQLRILFFTFIISLLIGVCMTTACKRSPHDPRLTIAASLASDNPRAALDSLHGINPSELSEDDRHYLDLLTIKAGDKLFIRQPDDSLIRTVLDYYSHHIDDPVYPEALYYGGRVYSDLGDAPTALDYYHKSLNLTEGIKEYDLLHELTLSQCGYLLSLIRMYDEAVSTTEKALAIDMSRNPVDTIAVYYNLFQLGETYLRAGNLHKAESVTRLALTFANEDLVNETASCYVNLAEINRQLGNFEKSREYSNIAKLHSRSDSNSYLIMREANLYYDLEKYDSAFLNADILIHGKEPQQRPAGYQLMLTPELRQFVPEDSLYVYLDRYRTLLIKRYEENDAQMAVAQQSLYNYGYHQRKAKKSEKQKNLFQNIILLLLLIADVTVVYLILRRKQHRKTIQDLKDALDAVMMLEKSESKLSKQLKELNLQLEKEMEEKETLKREKSDELSHYVSKKIEMDGELRKELRSRLVRINDEYIKKGIKIPVPQEIIKSKVYRTFSECLEENIIVAPDSELWDKLRALVEKVSPGFCEKIELLVRGDLRSFDIQTSLLIKCGFGPKQIGMIMGRGGNTISTRKKSLAARIFDDDISARGIEGIIQLL